MSELINHYQQQFNQIQTVELDWLKQLRQQAWQTFAQAKFPTRKDEDWKYTNVTPIIERRFELDKGGRGQLDDLTYHGGWQFDVRLGQTFGNTPKLPQGVILDSLQHALAQNPQCCKPYLAQVANIDQHGFTALNTALLAAGVFIYVPQNTVLDEPIHIVHAGDDNGSYPVRHCIVAEAGSRVSVIEEYRGAGSYFTNTVTEIIAKPGAVIEHYKLQTEDTQAYHIGSVHCQIHAEARVNTHSFSFGGALVRSDTQAEFKGEHGHCTMNGLYCVQDGQHVDHHTTVWHQLPHCSSDEFYKGVLSGKSRAVFNGKVVVAPHAQKTDATQQNKNLLLSKAAEIDTKPQLEIYADDVKCAHGATVGQLDDDALFYLRSRGLSLTCAREFLIQAFVADRIERVSIDSLRQQLTGLVATKRMK